MTDAARPTSEERLDETFARIRDPKLEGGKVFTTLYETSARHEAEASDARVAAAFPHDQTTSYQWMAVICVE
jgi:aspartyl-tRNA(Asn)/glutamyl-tRNA(Gln) amidotransferase subunit A